MMNQMATEKQRDISAKESLTDFGNIDQSDGIQHARIFKKNISEKLENTLFMNPTALKALPMSAPITRVF